MNYIKEKLSIVNEHPVKKKHNEMFDYFRKGGPFRISLCSRCNAQCQFCHNEGNPNKSLQLDIDDVLMIVEALSKAGVKKITFTGGEPLMYYGISELLMRLPEHDNILSLTTNGILLGKYIDKIAMSRLNQLTISLHVLHGSPEKIMGITKQCDLDLIKYLSKYKRIIINTVFLNDYIDESIALIDYCTRNNYTLKIMELMNEQRDSEYEENFDFLE